MTVCMFVINETFDLRVFVHKT